jgi:hypothetical protein
MRRLPWIVAAAALALAAAAIAVPALAGEDSPKRVVVQHASDRDDNDDKEAQAHCPEGFEITGGGGGITHGDETPSVALYQSYPMGDSWLAMAHETDPEPPRQTWEVWAVAICVEKN